MRAAVFKARFYGIYEWGRGWMSIEKQEAWDSWFGNLKSTMNPSFWSYFDSESFTRAKYLVCSSGSVYLHPMDVSCIIHTSTVTKKLVNGVWKETFPELDELKEILTGVANACGGGVEFSDVTVGDLPDPKFGRKE